MNTASTIPIAKKGYTYIKVGSRCILNKHLSNPKKANFTSTPLRKIEKLVEAST